MDTLDRLPIPLLAWYRENARDLPWRREPTAYHVLVSEIMLQQTRVAAVLDYYGRFLEALPTAEDLARCPEERLMKLWQGLGYYTRARNLQRAARQIVEEHHGVFPRNYEAIRSLAGVGEYTAGAIASIAFGTPVSAVDGNVLRVVSRLTDDHRDMTRPETRRDVARALEAVLPRDCPGDFNQALMELGAVVCLPNGAPLCERCPAGAFCVGRQKGSAAALPVKRAKKPRRVEERIVYIIIYQGRVALRQRPAKGLLAGLWEYPNGLSPWPCPVKGRIRPAAAGKHIFTHVEWHMTACLVQAEGEALPPGWVWADWGELEERYSIPSAFACFQGKVKENMTKEKKVE